MPGKSRAPISPDRWQHLDRIFGEALDRRPQDRDAFLYQACAGDPDLRREIDALLIQDAAAANFIETPAAAAITSLPDVPQGSITCRTENSLAGQRLGAFLLEQEIGRGGMGTVYRALRDDGAFSQQVAIKIVTSGWLGSDVLERFRRERQILALMSHPHIAQIFDGGSTSDGRPYLVMELVEGKSLIEHCAANKLGLPERLRLFLDVCAAVAHAHQNLIIHRDLKPANIMVDPSGRIKLLDFGIAKLFHPDLPDEMHTRAANSFLTPEYASPEQVRLQRITTASDIYALGLILFELLTGQKAQRVTSSSMLDIERSVCEAETRKPSEALPEGTAYPPSRLRGDLDNIVLKATRKDPARRYSTVNQLAEDIERYLNGRPVSARADSFLYRSGKFLRRNRLAAAGSAVVLASLIGGTAVAMWQARIAQDHFNSVRGLAKALLTEINPALNNVPGTTKARHLIVSRSLEYLDKLSRSAGTNVDLLFEMAAAYETVGNLQGNRNKENIGDYPGALRSFHRALTLYEQVEALSPSPSNRLWMVYIRAEAARVYPNSDAALQLAREALVGANSLDHDYPGKYVGAVANAWFGLAYVYAQREQVPEAIDAFTRSREFNVAAKRSRNNLAVNDRYIAILYLLLRNAEKADWYLQRATRLDEERVQEEPGPRARMDLTYDYENQARALLLRGEVPAALNMARHCQSMRDELARADPHDNRARMAKGDIDEVLGSIYGVMGDRKETVDHFTRALQVRESLVAAAPDSPEDKYDLGRALSAAAEAYSRLGLCQDAGTMAQRAQAIFERQRLPLSLANLNRPTAQLCDSLQTADPDSARP